MSVTQMSQLPLSSYGTFLWHIDSYTVTLGSYILGSPRTFATRFRTRLVWLCSDGNYFCNKAYCHAVTMVLYLLYVCV